MTDSTLAAPENDSAGRKTIGRNILAVIAGIVVGSLVNMLLVGMGPAIVPLPEGADVSTTEGLRESMQYFSPINFLVPFLAHALGTLSGAFTAAKIAGSHHVKIALVVGLFFLAGGIAAVIMLGGPLWFQILDLVVAYLPMAYLGALLARRKESATAVPA